MRRRYMAAAILAVSLFLVGMRNSNTPYDNDSHFYYTYFLARLSDFSPEDALRIASANVAVDYDSRTEPFQNMGFGSGAQSVRTRFHAFVPAGGRTSPYEVRERRRLDAYERAWDGGNPGAYLHFYMDIYSHAGFQSQFGHAVMGHLPDFLSTNSERARRMTRGVLSILWGFRTGRSVPHVDVLSPDAVRAQWPTSGADATRVEDAFRRALPVLRELMTINDPSYTKRPNSERARAVVSRALNGESVPTFGERIPFTFDRDGHPRERSRWEVMAPRVHSVGIERVASGNRRVLRVEVDDLIFNGPAPVISHRIQLNGQKPDQITTRRDRNRGRIVLIIEDGRMRIPGTHSLYLDNVGPGGRIYRMEFSFHILPSENIRRQSSGRGHVVFPRP